MNDASTESAGKSAGPKVTASSTTPRSDTPYERTIFFVSDGTGITAETFGI